jgi:hypothetical protein
MKKFIAITAIAAAIAAIIRVISLKIANNEAEV